MVLNIVATFALLASVAALAVALQVWREMRYYTEIVQGMLRRQMSQGDIDGGSK